MARHIPADRLQQLVDTSTAVFIRQSYRLTQMADVAAAMGVAKGTLYLYVESKEALFDLVCRCADDPHFVQSAPALPIRTPKPGATLRYVRERIAREGRLPRLAAAVGRRRAPDVGAELTAIVSELYDLLNRHRTAIRLVESCARDYPELAALWYADGREAQLGLLTRYVDVRTRAGQLHPFGDTALVARVMLENVAAWAVHRYWDPRLKQTDDAQVRHAVVDFVVRALIER